MPPPSFMSSHPTHVSYTYLYSLHPSSPRASRWCRTSYTQRYHRSALSVPHTRALPLSRPLTSPSLISKVIHISDPHFRHVCCLRRGNRLEAVAVFLEAKCAVDCVAHYDKEQGSEDDDENDDEEWQGVTGDGR
jgi:hypothetical protein